jgi:hypothetical protein
MEVLNKSEPFAQVYFHSTLRDSDISDKNYESYLVDWKEKMSPNRLEYLMFYNINDVEIMIFSIDNLIKMFFQWKVDMLANITLASFVQYMKFKLLYDDLVRTHPLKPNNQPVITLYNTFNNNNNNNNKNKIVEENNNNNNLEINEYGDDVEISEEEDNRTSIDFTTAFSEYFDNNELRN